MSASEIAAPLQVPDEEDVYITVDDDDDEGAADCDLKVSQLLALVAPFRKFFSASSSVTLKLSFEGLLFSKTSDARTHALRFLVPREGPRGHVVTVRGFSARRLEASLRHLSPDLMVHLDLTSVHQIRMQAIFPYGPASFGVGVEVRRSEAEPGELDGHFDAATHLAVPLSLLRSFLLTADALEVLYCRFDVAEGYLVVSCAEERRRPHSRSIDCISDLELRYPLSSVSRGEEEEDSPSLETTVKYVPVSLLADLVSCIDCASDTIRLGLHPWGVLVQFACNEPLPGAEAQAVVLRRALVPRE
jgi:hypothetical protein